MSRVSDEPTVTMICEKSYRVSPGNRLNLDLNSFAKRLGDDYQLTNRGASIIVKLESGVSVTVMSTGGALVQGIDDEKEALSIYCRLLSEATRFSKTDD